MYLADEAINTFQQAILFLAQQPDIKTRIDSLNGLALSFDSLSKCSLSEPQANLAIDLSEQTNYIAGKAEALITLSHCQNHRDHALAMKGAQDALKLWLSLDRKRGIAEAHVAIGEYQMAQTDLIESERSLQTALGLYRELNAVDQQATILIHLGFVEQRKSAWQNAMGFYTQAQSLIDEKAEPYRMAQIAGGLGESFLESGLPEVALAKFREGLDYFRLSKAQRGVSAMIWLIGRAQYMSGNYRDALESLGQARNDAVSNSDPALAAFCDDFLGRTYYESKDYAAALSHFHAALEGYARAKNPMEAARVQALIGRVYQQQGSLTRARGKYETALTVFRSLSDHLNESATLYAMGTLELRENHLDTAETFLRQSIEVTENIRRVSTNSDLAAAFSATVHERYEGYIECLMRQHREHPDRGLSVRAFEMSELARARSLAELLRTTQTNLVPGLDPNLAQQEKSLRQSLKVKEDSKVALLARKYTRDELQVLDAELANLEAEYERVTRTIRAQYPSYEQITKPDAWTLKQIQDDVIADDQTVLLEYSLGNDHSYVWVVTKNEIRSYDLPAQARISEVAQRVRQLLSTMNGVASKNEAGEATQELATMILSPVAAELGKHRVLVVSDDALNYIPFQTLPSPLAGHELLVANYEVINAPSASILGQLRRERARRQTPEGVLAVFGDPIFASNYPERKDRGANDYVASNQPDGDERWQHALRDIEPTGEVLDPANIQPLFYAGRELTNLSEVAGAGTFVASGFEATRERLGKTDLTKFAILHFATHGILDRKRPENSGLFLSMVDRGGKAQNGFVGLQDIYSLRAPVDLVVLSACRTGLGKDLRGEGLIGLTRGFMYAGASSVVASLWKVDDEATAELMKRFYRNMLQDRMTPPAALRAAQNSIRHEPQWSAPYYWAAFTLQGDYRYLIEARPAARESMRPLITIGIVMLILLPVLYRSFRRMRTELKVASYTTVKK
jgi:CHAT domain-containing protein